MVYNLDEPPRYLHQKQVHVNQHKDKVNQSPVIIIVKMKSQPLSHLKGSAPHFVETYLAWSKREHLKSTNQVIIDGKTLDIASVVTVARYSLLSQSANCLERRLIKSPI